MDFHQKDFIVIGLTDKKLYDYFLEKWSISPFIIDVYSSNVMNILKNILIKYSSTHSILLIISSYLKNDIEYVGNNLAKDIFDTFYGNSNIQCNTICLVETMARKSIFNLNWQSNNLYIFKYKHFPNNVTKNNAYCINHINIIDYFYDYMNTSNGIFCIRNMFLYIKKNSKTNPILSRI